MPAVIDENPSARTIECSFQFIGHSLGGAKAEMAVLSMLLKRMVTQNKVRLLTFGSARVGDMSFVNLIEALVSHHEHYIIIAPLFQPFSE